MSQSPTEQLAQGWATTSAMQMRLAWMAGLSLLMNVALVGVGAWYLLSGLPIHYIAPGTAGVSLPGVIPDSLVGDVAGRCLAQRYTFTPSTVKAAHSTFLACLHPQLRTSFQVQAGKEVPQVKEAQLSSQLSVFEATVSRRFQGKVLVRVTGMRTVWVGGHQVREESIQADVTIVPWIGVSTAEGFVVSEMAVEPKLSFGVN